MNIGDKVKLKPAQDIDCVLPEIREWIGEKTGVIVEADYWRDWVVQYQDTPRVGNQFALDESDMVVVEDCA